jgi:hypothetical protein
MEEISLDDPMYTNKHIQKVGGWGWPIVSGLCFLSWIITFVLMVVENEFSLWPLAFFVAGVFVMHKFGRSLLNNGYLEPEKRKAALDAKAAKDREDA